MAASENTLHFVPFSVLYVHLALYKSSDHDQLPEVHSRAITM